MTPQDVRRMVQMVRAIRAGKWTDEPPAWSRDITATTPLDVDNVASAIRAIQTAEAFILLAHSSDIYFDEMRFLQDCGFLRKPQNPQ